MARRIQPDIAELLGDGASSNLPVPGGRRVSSGTGKDLALVGEAHEGASMFDRELALWQPSGRSADLDTIPEKFTADTRVRDMVRNDAYMQGGADIHKDSVVGAYFMLNAKPSSKTLFGKEDTDWEDEFQEEVEEKFAFSGESTDNWLDASRQSSLTGLARMAVGSNVFAGESISSVEWIRESGRPFSTAIQIIDPDRLRSPPQYLNDRNVRGGVRLNSWGAPVGYYIRMAHPSEFFDPNSQQTEFIPARKPWGRRQMLHIFERNRAAQSRGMSMVVAALKEMKQTKRFREIMLQNAVVQATFAASIESDMPPAQALAAIGVDDVSKAIEEYTGGYLNSLTEYAAGLKGLTLDGVKIPHLFPGTKLQLRPVGKMGPLGTDFEHSLLRYIAAALGISYEELSRDYTQTNYSSARAAMSTTWRAMQSLKKRTADTFATLVYQLWFEELFNAGSFETLKRRRSVNFYDPFVKEALTACDWVGASRGQIDELKETQAAVLRINNGLSTIEMECARLGLDWRKTLRQLKREKEWKEEYGILLRQTDTTNQENALSAEPSDGSGNT